MKRFDTRCFLFVMLAALMALLLGGCGSGGPSASPAVDQVAGSGPVTLMVSNPQLNSDDATKVTLTALVRDSNNRAISGQKVTFATSSGVLVVTSDTTDANGQATATLGTAGDPTNRQITVTATSGSYSATNTVDVVNTNIDISGLTSLSFGASTNLTITLKNSSGSGISGKTISVTSAKGNTLSATSWVTDGSGQISVTVRATAAGGGLDTITASAIGATKTFALTVNATILQITSPPSGSELDINTNYTYTVQYTASGSPVAGVPVTFSATRGTLSSQTATTDASGNASVTVSSAQSGPAVLSAFVTNGPSDQVPVEFVATTSSSVTLQVSPAVIGTNSGGATTEKSLITAVVRDANDNLVKNRTVVFSIVSDASGGYLSPGSAITDSAGTANTYFIGGPYPGGNVSIRARVTGTSISSTIPLTVAKKALFISLATGNKITIKDDTRYQKDYVALVTDSVGNPVVGATITAKVRPVYYRKGYYVWSTESNTWVTVQTLLPAYATISNVPACINEDTFLHKPLYDHNGVLDIDSETGVSEDVNGNGRLDPGTVASVTATTTDSTGHSVVSIVYAKDYAAWVNVKLEAWASLGGSTTDASVSFDLPVAVEDLTSLTTPPPGDSSPFGTSHTCYAGLVVVPISSSWINLSWTESSQAVRYKIYRDLAYLKSVENMTSTSDTGLAAGTQYCYYITMVDAAGVERTLTDAVCGTTTPSSITTMTPTGLTATAASASQINLSWTAVANATGYKIYQGGVLRKAVTLNAATDDSLTANTQYCYTIKAYDSAGNESFSSGQACATTSISAPSAPTGLAATSVSATQIDLSWTASAGAAGYNIYRTGGSAGPLTLSSTTTSLSDMTATVSQTQYCYRVSAFDVSGNESALSSQVCSATQ